MRHFLVVGLGGQLIEYQLTLFVQARDLLLPGYRRTTLVLLQTHVVTGGAVGSRLYKANAPVLLEGAHDPGLRSGVILEVGPEYAPKLGRARLRVYQITAPVGYPVVFLDRTEQGEYLLGRC